MVSFEIYEFSGGHYKGAPIAVVSSMTDAEAFLRGYTPLAMFEVDEIEGGADAISARGLQFVVSPISAAA